MTRQQIIEEIRQFSVADRIALIEEISRGLREELGRRGESSAVTEPEVVIAAGLNESSLARQLYGALKLDGLPPTDDEVKDIISEYLSEKYS